MMQYILYIYKITFVKLLKALQSEPFFPVLKSLNITIYIDVWQYYKLPTFIVAQRGKIAPNSLPWFSAQILPLSHYHVHICYPKNSCMLPTGSSMYIIVIINYSFLQYNSSQLFLFKVFLFIMTISFFLDARRWRIFCWFSSDPQRKGQQEQGGLLLKLEEGKITTVRQLVYYRYVI